MGGGHNTRIETAFLFVQVPFFFFLTQVRQVKVVFLRILRNAATRLRGERCIDIKIDIQGEREREREREIDR